MTTNRTLPTTLALALGYLALVLAVASAYASPTTGAELSIYGATPTTFWIAVGVALVLALLVSLGSTGRPGHRTGAYVLAGGGVIAIVALPILRGYHFYGRGDALSHLGWARMLDSGALDPFDLLYPSIHAASVFVHSMTGVELTQAVLFVVVVSFALYLCFIPLCIRTITDDPLAVMVGVFSGLLVLPVNIVSVHPIAHPTTQAILFLPVILYLLVRYLTGPEPDADRRVPVSAVGALLLLATFAMILFHPQQALNVVLLLATIAVVQFVVRRYRDAHPIHDHHPVYGLTVVVALVYVLWTVRFERVHTAIGDVTTGLLTGAAVGAEVGQRAVSLGALGTGIEELFVKLFLVSAVYVALTVCLVLVHASGRPILAEPSGNAIVTYLVVASIPAGVLFALFFVADAATQYLRYVGFLMVFATILGALAVARGARGLVDRGFARTAFTVLAVVFAIFLVLQLATVHPSPYVYQPAQDVPESEVAGYAAAFEARNETIPMHGITAGPLRFAHAHYGTDAPEAEVPGARDTISTTVFDNIDAWVTDSRYIVVGESDVQTEIELFEELRYSEQGFESLDRTVDLHRVQSTGGTDLYLLAGDDS